jgi:Bacterial Ig-like domain (group 3)
MFTHRALVFGVIGAALSAGLVTSALAAPEATPAASASCYSACTSETTLYLSRDVVFYGHEQVETFRVTVRPGHLATGTPTGTVAIVSRGKTLCTATLADGDGSCSLTADELQLGLYKVRAVYSGDSSFRLSNSKSHYLEVRRAFRRHRHHFPFNPFAASKDRVPDTAARAW